MTSDKSFQRIILRVLKFMVCAYGGGVLATMVFIACTMTVFGARDLHQVEVLEDWKMVVWLSGALWGAWVAYRSDRHGRGRATAN